MLSRCNDVHIKCDKVNAKIQCKLRFCLSQSIYIFDIDGARISYKSSIQSHHKNFKISPSGLVINPLYPHLGASPDGIICCDCCGKGVLEIKCPYNAHKGSPQESVNSIDCLHILNGELHLNTSHDIIIKFKPK